MEKKNQAVAVHHVEMSTSDHSLLSLRIALQKRTNKKIFNFEAM